jgi:myo-inositol-1(or 4)-monophosphatase
VTHPPADGTELRDLALTVARAAAALVRDQRAAGVSVADTKTSATDVVTEVDRASEELIRGLLLEARPDDSILGEEGDDHRGSSDVLWIVDPIDGTVNFLYGLPQYAVSIAAEVGGQVVAGVVLNVVTGVEFTAVRGKGATKDGVPIAVGGTPSLEHRLVLTGFSYRPGLRAAQAEQVARLLPRVRDIRRIGSSALDICHVAEGAGDAYVEEGSQRWDWSAAALVAEEAGARFGLLRSSVAAELGGPGADGTPTVVVCAPEEGWDSFVGLLVECGFVAADPPLRAE